MRNSDCLANPILGSVKCNWTAVPAIIGAVASVAFGGISLIAQQSAAAQAAANAQAVADYNAQVQEQNAQLSLQLATYQAEQNAAIAKQQNDLIQSQINQQQQTARANIMLSQSQQQAATAASTAAATQASLSQSQAAMEAAISRSNAQASEINAQFARQQAEAAQQRYNAGIENAKQLDIYAEQVQAQQREDAKRTREEAETRNAQIRAKYAGSGVTFEGSPLVVLADSARLSEAIVQDQAFASELEARKQQRAADLARFEAGFSLIDKQGFMTQAAGFEIEASAHEIEALGHELSGASYGIANAFNVFKGQSDVFGLQIEQANQRSQIQQAEYESQIQTQRYQTQLEAANYDTLVAGERYKIDLSQADLTRFGGAVQASGIQADAQASLISGIGSTVGSAISGVSQIAKLTASQPKTSPGLIY